MKSRLLIAPVLLAFAGPASGQQADTAASPPVQAPATDTVLVPRGPTPAGAFLRSVLIPGWGQGTVGSYWRGGIYFGGHIGNVFMLLKTRASLEEIRGREVRREAFVRDSLMEDDPEITAEEIAAAVEGDAVRAHAASLRGSREQQQEDWLVFGGFWLLANAVDAYVAAQLVDFPGDLIIRPRADRRLELGVAIPAGGR